MFGSHLVLLAINYRWGIRLTDCQNGFRAIRTEAGRSIGLQENGFAIEQEMVMKCLIHGLRVGETGCHEYERTMGQSKLNLFTVWPDILRTLVVLSLTRANDRRPTR
jgi:dolichol-phosphate mannosyltransferase